MLPRLVMDEFNSSQSYLGTYRENWQPLDAKTTLESQGDSWSFTGCRSLPVIER